MNNDVYKHIKMLRQKSLPDDIRHTLIEARAMQGLSQRDLANRLGIVQTHISGIESGKIVPRYDTLLEIVRMLGNDLIMVPRALVPVVQALIRDHRNSQDQSDEGGERSLYAEYLEENNSEEPHDEV